MTYTSFKDIKEASGMTLASLAETLGIPPRTISDWHRGIAKPPAYVLNLIVHRLTSLGILK